MADYRVNIFWSDEDQSYIATVPDLEFCSAHGSTPQEALEQVLTAKEGWVEVARKHGDPIREPRYRPPDADRTAAG